MIARYDAIASYLTEWETHFVEPVVFGTTDAYQIACLLDAFCRRELSAAVADVLFYESSIGVVCGICLQDGRRVVVKVHQPSHTLEFLQAVVRVQHYLLAHGYPCTKPLLDPKPLRVSKRNDTMRTRFLETRNAVHGCQQPVSCL